MKKNMSNIMKSVGIAMAIGGTTAIVGSTMMGESKMQNMKKSVSKALKSMEKML